ncbi:MAG: hypothetical protein OEQ47_06045 [Acidimicrobiia bacterium]|nr:hypothetical protein [Acidimicrobiia bacterium]
MTLKSTLIVAALSLALAACSSDTSVSTTTAATPTTGAGQTTSTPIAEQTSSTASPATTEAPTTTTGPIVPDVIEIEISYLSGVVEGGGRIEVPLGESVVIRVDSDVADEGHLHGYDIFVDVEPGTTGVVEFVADIPGIFELELEGARVLLADLEIAP